jgi:hypothetical protein
MNADKRRLKSKTFQSAFIRVHPRFHPHFLLAVLALLLIAAAPTTKESPTGTVTGLAVDTSNNALAECVVSATEGGQRMRVARTAETDKDGKFSIDLPEGSWTITLTTKDTKLKGAKSAEVVAGQTLELGKITLRPRKVGAR